MSRIALLNEPVARMTPVEVEVVAAAIKIPEMGARNVPEMPEALTSATTSVERLEAEMSPAMAPAPIKISTVAVIFCRPVSITLPEEYWKVIEDDRGDMKLSAYLRELIIGKMDEIL